MSRKKVVGVIGDANLQGDEKKEKISFELGKLLIDHDFTLANGGMGGVMESASKGAKSSSKYQYGSIIGVIPDYNDSKCNDFLDIVIPTGMGLARNVILTSMCDAVISIGGGSGTLSEIALAWQMGKLVIAIDAGGWSTNLKSARIDRRRNDKVFSAESAEEAIDTLLEKIDDYPLIYSGVQKSRLGEKEARNEICQIYKIVGQLKLLGKGSEGQVFKDEEYVYKVIDNDHPLLNQYWRLKALSEDIDRSQASYLIPFEVALLERAIIIRYKFFETKPYLNGDLRHLRFLAKELRKIGWLITDFQPKNIRIRRDNGKPVIVDLGHSFEPYHEDLFRKMCRRMFVSSMIGNRVDIKPYLSETNDSEEFIGLEKFGIDPQEAKRQFLEFYQKVMLTEKKDVLNPLMISIIRGTVDVKTIFDYGSGYGDLAFSLHENKYKVTAYDIDSELFDEYKDKYYKNVEFLNYEGMKEAISKGLKFDMTVLSLVLCHPLSDDSEERKKIIEGIMADVRSLTRKYVLVSICNPLYSNREKSQLQYRTVPDDFEYSYESKIIKRIHSSNREREDYHRPISYYTELFAEHGLRLLRIDQTSELDPVEKEVLHSDFMVFLLEVNDW